MSPLRRLTALLAPALIAATAFAPAACAQDDFASDAARLVSALHIQPGQSVADIGAGRGELALALAREVGASGRVYATEIDQDRLDDIREAARDAGLHNVEVLEAHAVRTNLPDGCCDALVMRRVYHHIDDPARMNASMLQTLKPGGMLAIIDFDPDEGESADPSGRDEGNHHGVTSATVARELGEAGFEQVAVTEADRPGRYMVVVRRPSGR